MVLGIPYSRTLGQKLASRMHRGWMFGAKLKQCPKTTAQRDMSRLSRWFPCWKLNLRWHVAGTSLRAQDFTSCASWTTRGSLSCQGAAAQLNSPFCTLKIFEVPMMIQVQLSAIECNWVQLSAIECNWFPHSDRRYEMIQVIYAVCLFWIVLVQVNV